MANKDEKKLEGKEGKKPSVLSIRIDANLNDVLDSISEEKRITKATLIRNYLEMAKYVFIDQKSIKSSNENDLVMIKRNFFKVLISKFEEEDQIDIGIELARFINDLARIEGKIEDVSFKLDLCEHLGLFSKKIDKENYILISNEFGPKKFVEAFVYHMIKMGAEQDFDKSWVEEKLKGSKDARKAYTQKISPITRSAEHYSFEFAKIPIAE